MRAISSPRLRKKKETQRTGDEVSSQPGEGADDFKTVIEEHNSLKGELGGGRYVLYSRAYEALLSTGRRASPGKGRSKSPPAMK